MLMSSRSSSASSPDLASVMVSSPSYADMVGRSPSLPSLRRHLILAGGAVPGEISRAFSMTSAAESPAGGDIDTMEAS